MNVHFCRFCEEPIELDAHANSYYCPEKDCAKKAKQIMSLKRYHDMKNALKAFSVSDMILATFYNAYGEGVYIPGILLDQAGMDWLISMTETTIDNLPVKVLGDYSYCLFQNETVKIWKTLSLQKVNQ